MDSLEFLNSPIDKIFDKFLYLGKYKDDLQLCNCIAKIMNYEKYVNLLSPYYDELIKLRKGEE